MSRVVVDGKAVWLGGRDVSGLALVGGELAVCQFDNGVSWVKSDGRVALVPGIVSPNSIAASDAGLLVGTASGAFLVSGSGAVQRRFGSGMTLVHEFGRSAIAVVSAGTSDIFVAEEAQITAETMGNQVETIFDIGVAGIHRLMSNRERLMQARVIVVCAGMEGALPSVVGGLVSCPVIAVPTSVVYGASFHGLAALLGMLNSCASNVTVVNIDNGFGAGYVASIINQL